MTDVSSRGVFRYCPPAPQSGRGACALAAVGSTTGDTRFIFYDEIAVGRDDGRVELAPAVLLVAEPTVSRRHCVIARRPDGRCVIRDVSRNGTRLDGRRLVPNIEVEIRVGQRITLAEGCELVLLGDEAASATTDTADDYGVTVGQPGSSFATVLVGDIRDYTGLVQDVPSLALQRSVTRVFEIMTDAVEKLGGTVKEYQGDAVVAFWEGTLAATHVARACKAAIELDTLALRLAGDRSVWQIEEFELKMDWALATGMVVINTFGGIRPAGLSMVGEPIVLAFRLERLASDDTGRILSCPVTRQLAGPRFLFRDLGEMTAKGFAQAQRVFALTGERTDDTVETARVKRL